jgi:hypothetical protein
MIAFMSSNFIQQYMDCNEMDAKEMYEEDGETEKKENKINEKDYIYDSADAYFLEVEEINPIDTYLCKRYDSESDILTPPPELLSC